MQNFVRKALSSICNFKMWCKISIAEELKKQIKISNLRPPLSGVTIRGLAKKPYTALCQPVIRLGVAGGRLGGWEGRKAPLPPQPESLTVWEGMALHDQGGRTCQRWNYISIRTREQKTVARGLIVCEV